MPCLFVEHTKEFLGGEAFGRGVGIHSFNECFLLWTAEDDKYPCLYTLMPLGYSESNCPHALTSLLPTAISCSVRNLAVFISNLYVASDY